MSSTIHVDMGHGSTPSDRNKRHSARRWIKMISIASLCLLILALAVGGTVNRQDAVGIASLDFTANATRNDLPIPCHSHNNYRRAVPLFDAPDAGCTSVEADIWLIDKNAELYVGHKRHSLSEGRTLRSLYLDSLIGILNGTSSSNVRRNLTTRGVFDTDREQTLVLLLDLKTDGKRLFPHIQEHLQPLREVNLLSFNNGTYFISRPITIVVSGNEPFDLIAGISTHRDIFFDAPLDKLRTSKPRSWNSTNSFYVSTSLRHCIGYPWLGRSSSKQLSVLRGQIREAHPRGLRVRYRDTPTWPVWMRDRVWRVLLDEGVDVLNVDELQAAALIDWAIVRHG